MKTFMRHKPARLPQEQQSELISVIVAVYNIEEYVEKCVLSILKQSYRNLEIILVDDGSTDDSGHICDKLANQDQRICVLHKANGGLADARNTGLAAAKGSLIAFVDGDDWIDEDMYEKMYLELSEHDADIAVCRYRQVYRDKVQDDSTQKVILFEEQEALQCYVEERDEYNIQNAAWNKLYRKEILKGMKFPTGRWYEDMMFTTRVLSRVKSCVYLDSACYNYIIDREGSIMNTRINPRIFTDLIPAYREKTEFLKEIGRQDLADIHDYFINKRLLIFYNEIKKSDNPEKRKYLDKITSIINEGLAQSRSDFERIYNCSIANPNEKRKMNIFLKSPKLYWFVMLINEAFILPLKTRSAIH